MTHTKNKYISTRTFLKRLHWISLHSPHLYAVRNSLILDLAPGAAQSICVCPDYEPHNLVWEQQPESQQDTVIPPPLKHEMIRRYISFNSALLFFLNRDVDMKCECALALSKGKGSLCVWMLTITVGRDSLRSKTKVSRFFKAAFFKQSKNCLLDLNVVSNIKKKKNPISKL